MSTINQKRVAKDIVDTTKSRKKYNAQKSIEKSGYSKNTARGSSKKIIESKGVKEELEKAGFSVEAIDKVVDSILHKGQEPNRLRAADLGYKRLGAYEPQKFEDVTKDKRTPEELDASIKRLIEETGFRQDVKSGNGSEVKEVGDSK